MQLCSSDMKVTSIGLPSGPLTSNELLAILEREKTEVTAREELVMLLEERTLSHFERRRRRRRLQTIRPDVRVPALQRARTGKPLTLEEYVAVNLGFLPGECPLELWVRRRSRKGTARGPQK